MIVLEKMTPLATCELSPEPTISSVPDGVNGVHYSSNTTTSRRAPSVR